MDGIKGLQRLRSAVPRSRSIADYVHAFEFRNCQDAVSVLIAQQRVVVVIGAENLGDWMVSGSSEGYSSGPRFGNNVERGSCVSFRN